jgi:CRISPR/Cas system-associated exonuclease Cas4 (RecB family)
LKTLRASKIGSYLYCKRAWWYAQRGETPENQAELAAGSALHVRHGRQVLRSGCLRIVAYALLLAGLALLAVYLTQLLV